MKSTLTGNEVRLVKNITSEFIIQGYKKTFGVDVGRFFQKVKQISLLECLDSGYKFYYPLNLAGDSLFYESFQKFDWYYMPDKWEYKEAEKYIKKEDHVLEIGCATGSFIKRLINTGAIVTGLELNKKALLEGKSNGLTILSESIEEHSNKKENFYDMVCSFQVTEHVTAIRDFLASSIKAVKPGGKLIISVPNNDFLVFKTHQEIFLNMPPHHMGLWDNKSLSYLPNLFNIELEKIIFEPLQKYHFDAYTAALIEKIFGKYSPNNLTWLISKVMQKIYPIISRYITGQTIMAIYTKKQ
jgi:SAM-dependent methyltransferase